MLSLKEEKYLNKINRLNAFDVIKLNKVKEVEVGIADANSDYMLYDKLQKELAIIEALIEVRMFLN
jgi:type I site-specific restriction endonuclease